MEHNADTDTGNRKREKNRGHIRDRIVKDGHRLRNQLDHGRDTGNKIHHKVTEHRKEVQESGKEISHQNHLP